MEEEEILNVKIGDRIKFGTQWKYNPGFLSTKYYYGIIEDIVDDRIYVREEEDGKFASIKVGHINEICNETK